VTPRNASSWKEETDLDRLHVRLSAANKSAVQALRTIGSSLESAKLQRFREEVANVRAMAKRIDDVREINAAQVIRRMIERGLEKMTKVDLEAIMQLRNRAIAMLKGASWQNDVEGNRALICETDDLRIAYAGPFRWAAEVPSEMKHFAAAINENGPLPHKLTVWLRLPTAWGRRFFCAHWFASFLRSAGWLEPAGIAFCRPVVLSLL
jgi:hypothetical protein